MAESSNANNMPEGTTLIFGSWALTADGSGGFTGHLIAPKEPKAITNDQLVVTAEFGGNPSTQASPDSNSENAANILTPTRLSESAESDATHDS